MKVNTLTYGKRQHTHVWKKSTHVWKDDFKILSSNCESSIERKISEALYIRTLKPTSNVKEISTRESINVSTIAVGHLSERSVIVSKYVKMTGWKRFTKLVPSQTLLRSSHRRCSVKKGVFKNSRKFTGKHLCWSHFLTKLLTFRPATLLNSDSNTDVFL